MDYDLSVQPIDFRQKIGTHQIVWADFSQKELFVLPTALSALN